MDADLGERLLSEDLEVQTFAIREGVRAVDAILAEAVRGIGRSSNPLMTCDALFAFGPALMAPLERQLDHETGHAVILCISLLLLRLGSRRGMDVVREEVRTAGELSVVALNFLAAANVVEAGPDVVQLLRQTVIASRFVPTEEPRFNALFSAMKRLGVMLPEDVRAALGEEGVPVQIATAAERMGL